jgi:hypothetical protein
LLNWALKNLLLRITGKKSIDTPPAISLEALNNHHERHEPGGDDEITLAALGASAVDETDTNTTKDKLVSNLLAKGWEDNKHSHANKTTLDAVEEALTTVLKAAYDAAVLASHAHSNKAVLDAIQEALTTALKSNYDDAYSHSGVATGNPHAVTAADVGSPALVSPSVADNFVSFSDTAGGQKDSGSKAADFAAAGHNHTGTYEPADADIQSHLSNTSNPHSVTKTQVSLGNVDDVQQLPLSYLDTDGTLAANSDTKVPSQKAVKTYVGANAIPAPASPEQGDVLYYSGAAWARLAHGTAGQALKSGGHGANPAWAGFAWEFIAESVLGADAASVDFSSIASGYKYFMVLISACASSSTDRYIYMRFNGDTGSNYYDTSGGISSGHSSLYLGASGQYTLPKINATYKYRALSQILICNDDSAKSKIVAGFFLSPGAAFATGTLGGLWREVSTEINQITFIPSGDNIESGSTFRLYGVRF